MGIAISSTRRSLDKQMGELAGAGRKILKRLWPNDRWSRRWWFLARSAARILPSLFFSVSEDEDSKSSNSVSLKSDSEIRQYLRDENFTRDEAAHSMELLRSRTFRLSDDSGHATRSTLNAAGVKFSQKVSRPSAKEGIVDPINNLRALLPFRPRKPKRISFYHDGLVHMSQKCRPIVASERSCPSYVPTFPLPFSKRPLDPKGVSSTYQNLYGGSSKCTGKNCSSIHEGGGWSRFTGGSTVHPQTRRMAQKILDHIFESDSVEEITEEIEMGSSRPKPPMGISESKDPQEVFSGPSTSKSQNKDPSLSLRQPVCMADASDLFQVPKSQGHSQNELAFKPSKFGCTANTSRLFQVPKSQGHSQSESLFKPTERAKASDKSFGFAFTVSTTPKAFYEPAPMPTISSSQADNRPHAYQGHSRSKLVFKPNKRGEVSHKGFGFDFHASKSPKTFYKRAPMPTISSSQMDSRAHTYLGHSRSELSIKPNEGVQVSYKGFILDLLVSTAPKAIYKQAPMSTLSSSQADNRAHNSQGHSRSQPVIKPNERVEVSNKGFGFNFPISTAPKDFYEQAPMPTISSSQTDSRAHTYHGHSCSESIIKPNERVEVSDTGFGFHFSVSTTPKAFYKQRPISTISSSQTDSKAHTFHGHSHCESIFKPNERVDASTKDFNFVFPVSAAPKALYEPGPMHNISSSQTDSKVLPTNSDNDLDCMFPISLVSVPSEPPPTPQFKFGSKRCERSSNEWVDVSDEGFDFAFPVSTAPKALCEPAPTHIISSSQAESKAISTSSDNDLDYSFPVTLALVHSEPPPTPQVKFGYKKSDSSSNEKVDASDNDLDCTFPVSLASVSSKPLPTPQFKFGSKRRERSSNERVDVSDKGFDFAFPDSTAPKALHEPAPMHIISSSQADRKALFTSSDNDLDFSFPVTLALVHSEPPPTPQVKSGYKKRDSSSNENVDASNNNLDCTFPVSLVPVPSEPPPTPQFKFGSKRWELSSNEKVDVSDKGFDFAFPLSTAPKALYEPAPMHIISSSQEDSKALSTSSNNDLDFSSPVTLALQPESPPTLQVKFGYKKRARSSNEKVDASDKSFDFAFHVSSAPKALSEPEPMHTNSSSQVDNMALPTSSENNLDFTFPVLVPSEPLSTPEFKFGSKKRGSLSFKSVAESAICF